METAEAAQLSAQTRMEHFDSVWDSFDSLNLPFDSHAIIEGLGQVPWLHELPENQKLRLCGMVLGAALWTVIAERMENAKHLDAIQHMLMKLNKTDPDAQTIDITISEAEIQQAWSAFDTLRQTLQNH